MSIASTINVDPANDEPTLTATSANPTYPENSAPATLFSAAAASTIETGQTFASMTLTVSGLADGASELLFIDGSNVALTNGNVVVTATNGLTVNVSVAGNTATVTFTGASLTGGALQTLVNSLGYSNTDDTPTTTNRVVTITQLVDSGLNTAPNDNTAALGLVSTVGVSPTNDAPTFTGDGNPAVPFTENGSSVILDAGVPASISDPELSVSPNNYAGARLTIARSTGPNTDDAFTTTSTVDLTNSNGLGENVSLDGGATFIGTFVDNGDGSISFTFNATAAAADINTVMQNILYTNVSEDPPASVQIDFTFSDGNGQPGGQAQGAGASPGTVIGSFNVNITQINDRPELADVALNASYTIGAPGTLLSPTLAVIDVDSNQQGGLAPDAIVNAVVKIQDFFLGDQLFVNLPTSGGFFVVDDGGGPVVTNISVQSNSLGQLVLSGNDTPGHYRLVLDAVNYRSTNPDPTVGGVDGSRIITWQVNDGTPVSSLFATQVQYAAVPGPAAVASADLNGDGALDLVTANGATANISVLLGSTVTPGTFGAASNFAAGLAPADVVLADFDHNGTLDAAVANTNGVSILSGNGAGGFAPPISFAAGVDVRALATADFNNDGNLDLAVANGSSGGISVLIGNGSGGFAAPASFATGASPTGVAVGDFNRDGIVDLAVSNQGPDDVAILLGTGTGAFGAATTFTVGAGTNPNSVATGDLNGDGFLDVVTSNQATGDVSVLLGNIAGGLEAPTTFAAGTSPRDVQITDVNADGKYDIVVANSGGTNVSVLLGNGNGTFASAVNFNTANNPNSIALGDFNRDGGLDVAAANGGATTVSVLLNNGSNMSNVGTTLLSYNQPPTVDLDASAAGSGFANTFTENGAAVAIADSDSVVSDPETANTQTLTITLTNAKAGDALSLAGPLPAGIGSSINTSVAGVITMLLTGPAPHADFEVALELVQFSNSTEAPDTTPRDITVVANDGEGNGPAAHATITVVAVNDAPVNTVPGAQSAIPNTDKAIAGLAVSDFDAASSSLTTTLSVLHGMLIVSSAGGAAVSGSGTASVTLTGTLAQINTTLSASNNVVYRSDPGFNGDDTLTVLTNDGGNTGTGGAQSDTDTVTIVVSAPPVITSNGGGDTANVSVLERTAAVTTVVAADPDSPSLTYSIVGGSNSAKFQINASSGALSFVKAPNFDVPADTDHNNSYIVQVRASDGVLTDDQTLTVQVTDDPNVTSTVHWIQSVDAGPHPAGWLPAGTGDFNGDGTADLAWFNSATGNLDIWKLSNGAWAGSSNVGSHPPGYRPVGFSDYNNDGTDDILWYNPTTRDVDLWKISNAQWAGSVNIGTHPAGYEPTLSGDFNGDGTSDILWYNSTTRAVDIWKIDSNGQWAGSVDVGTHPAGYTPALAGDFNGDGTSDVLWHNPTTGHVDIWKIQNGQWAGSVDVGPHPLGWKPLGAADFNLDGTTDIAWHNPTTNNIDIWLIKNGQWAASFDIGSHPPGTAPGGSVFPLSPQPVVAVGVGDFDHNGVADIMWQDAGSNRIDNWLLDYS